LSAYADIQYRFVGYDFLGYDNQLRNVTQKANLNFINPKAGLTFSPSANTQIYGSFSTARREPNRDDYTQSSPQSRPRAENLYDSELGYKQLFGENFSILANAYYMYYIDQLVLTGKLNDVGAAIRTNVPKSYRAGLELQANLKLTKRLTISSNATLSQNKILNFSEFVDNWDTGAQENFEYKNVDIAFSPNLISTTNVAWRLVESDRQAFDLNLQTKYVGKQYLDNTQSAERALAGYWTSDLLARYQLKNTFLGIKNLSLTFSIRNLFNARYSSNGWTYRFRSDAYNPTPDDPYVSANTQTAGFYQQIGLYPQAGRNFMVGLNIRF
jgi:iron complex outermembrane recepter protein